MRGRFAVVLALLLLAPSWALAQGSITGVVRDSSGSVLPGVTVEASSDALIEKVRTAVTDGNGRFQIIDLRPGQYTVTFTLAGFNTTRRDDVTLSGGGTATIMVMGDKVIGKNIYGEYPTLALSSSIELGNGVLIPQISADEYFAELALWFGINPTDLPLIFPTLINFYQPGSGMPIGFLNT